ncbi:hypothetical protein AB1Y20_018612 [Prymnesium parvum]|uniref:Uncharacterized protein n=1 Tax=Prymnesium parvum TaxID=97485 RepID=A0AB34JNR1_PRYPA
MLRCCLQPPPSQQKDEASQLVKVGADADGAYESGGAVNLFSWSTIGLLVHSVVLGTIHYGLQSTGYGVFVVYLNVSPAVYATQQAVVSSVWAFQVPFALANDCLPVLGYRRKPYMAFGYALTTLAMFISAVNALPKPYWCQAPDGSYITDTTWNATVSINGSTVHIFEALPATPCNSNSQYDGTFFVLLQALATVGLLIAEVASNGLITEYARREGTQARGRSYLIFVMLKDAIGGTLGTLLVGLGLNGRNYDGTYDSGLSYNSVCAIFATIAAVMIPVSILSVLEPAGGQHKRSLTPFHLTFELLSMPLSLRLIIFAMGFQTLSNVSTPAINYVAAYWVGVGSLQNSISQLLQHVCYAVPMLLVFRYFLATNWRLLVGVPMLISAPARLLVGLLSSYGTYRNQYFFLFESIFSYLPSSMANAAMGLAIFELASSKNEGLAYACFSSALSSGTPIGRTVADIVYRVWRPSLSDVSEYVTDSQSFRDGVADSYLVTFVFILSAMILLPLLPISKDSVRHLIKSGRRDPRNAIIGALLFGVLTIFSCTYIIAFINRSPVGVRSNTGAVYQPDGDKHAAIHTSRDGHPISGYNATWEAYPVNRSGLS